MPSSESGGDTASRCAWNWTPWLASLRQEPEAWIVSPWETTGSRPTTATG